MEVKRYGELVALKNRNSGISQELHCLLNAFTMNRKAVNFVYNIDCEALV